MLFAITLFVWTSGILLAGQACFLLVECILSAIPINKQKHEQLAAKDGKDPSRPRVAVLVPAHNEQYGLAKTLRSILPQLRKGDRLLVVADNCDDDTAGIAQREGAEVLIRHDAELRGKGYALQAGVDHLRGNPPDSLIIIDGDCTLSTNCITSISKRTVMGKPVQTNNLQLPPKSSSGIGQRISAFAFLTKTFVRPLGLSRMGGPCMLGGTGMAFPWAVAECSHWATADIVEDMKLSTALVAEDLYPTFAFEACVFSEQSTSASALRSQQTRWEHGHVHTMLNELPCLLRKLAIKPRWKLFLFIAELSIPPLSLFVLAVGICGTASVLVAQLGRGFGPLILHIIAGCMLCTAILTAWAVHSRSLLPLRDLLGIPGYVLSKIPMYFTFLSHRQVAWVRTARDVEADPVTETLLQGPHTSLAGSANLSDREIATKGHARS